MSIVVVLQRPQDLVNIAAVVRAMKNFELRDLRLVQPAEYDPHRIEGISHKTGDILKRVEQFDDLDAALADCTHVAGLTARGRSAKRNVQRPREAAPELLAASAVGRAAILLGPEDAGLTNEELDRCHRIVTIPTNPSHASLNLAQAFCVMAYEVFVAQGTQPFKTPRRRSPPAKQAELERIFEDAERALDAIAFFETRNRTGVLRTIRELVHRVPLDAREASFVRSMCIEVARALERAEGAS
ncbi:MAG TPA: TrmH family RNA methyltransferase [Gemmatimonadales bacterium]|nr:TrmH family RNA methyltransferase [Gemmatimonadales bacterium]